MEPWEGNLDRVALTAVQADPRILAVLAPEYRANRAVVLQCIEEDARLLR